MARIKPELLHRFPMFDGLGGDVLLALASGADIEQLPARQLLHARDQHDDSVRFLLEGEVQLNAADGRSFVVNAGSERASKPLSVLQPHRYQVVSVTPVRCLRLDRSTLHSLLNRRREDSDIIVDESPSPEDPAHLSNPLFRRIYTDLKADKLVLPSLPEVALRVRRAMEDELVELNKVAAVVATDPAITARLIKVANSALYGGYQPVSTCAAAIRRLGLKATRNLVTSFAVQAMLQAKVKSPHLRRRLVELWHHSTEVAAIAFVLARHLHDFDPEQALLAGLLHDIGAMPVITYADQHPELVESQQWLDHAVNTLRGEIGALMLTQWGFSEPLVTAAREAERWGRSGAGAADYCDLLIVSQLHSFIGKQHVAGVPRLSEVPAFARLKLGELSPDLSLKILADARGQLQEARQLLAA